jgi:VWFA-related protein
MRWLLPALLLIVTFCPATARAQFRADVDLVTLDVGVRDASGKFIEGLSATDFVVFENGVRQQVEIFQTANTLPLNVVLLIDRSASMYGEKLERARAAAIEFGSRLRECDRLEIVAFNQRATTIATGAGEDAEWPLVLERLAATGSTALYDALVLAANRLERVRRQVAPAETRDLVIILSDGEDTASVSGFDEVLPRLRRTGALVYGLSLRVAKNGESLGATWPLQQIARDTGARAMGVPQLQSLAQLYAQIDQEVRQMYRLGYVSSDTRANGEWRQLTVRVAADEAHVQTRAGYYAARASANAKRGHELP